MKEALLSAVNEKSISDTKGPTSLILAVLLKYGIGPIACIYLGWVLTEKDKIINKNSDTLVKIVQEQTAATTRNTEVQSQLIKVMEANTSKLNQIETNRRERTN